MIIILFTHLAYVVAFWASLILSWLGLYPCRFFSGRSFTVFFRLVFGTLPGSYHILFVHYLPCTRAGLVSCVILGTTAIRVTNSYRLQPACDVMRGALFSRTPFLRQPTPLMIGLEDQPRLALP